MEERRGYARLSVESQVNYEVKGKSETSNRVQLQNISASGIKLITNEPLKKGTLLNLNFKYNDNSEQVSAEGEVVWQQKSARNQFETGVKFTQIDNEVKKKLMDYIQSTAGIVGEYREYMRCALKTEIKYGLIEDQDITKTCISDDISGLGIKVLFKEKIDVGSTLKFSFKLSEKSPTLFVEGLVIWKHKQEEGLTAAGIEFTKIKRQDKNKICHFVFWERSKSEQS